MARTKPWTSLRIVLLALLALGVGWVGFEVYLALTAKPGQSTGYATRINELVAARQPEGPNGWDDWMTALATLQSLGDGVRAQPPAVQQYPARRYPYDFDAVWDASAPDELRQATMRLVDQIERSKLHSQLADAAAQPRAQREVPEKVPILTILLPETSHFRELALYQRARMHLAADRGDSEEFATAFDELIRSAYILTHQGFLINHLVGHAIYGIAFEALERELPRRELGPAVLQRLADSLESHPPGSMALALETEHQMALDTLESLHTPRGRLIVSKAKSLQMGSKGEYLDWLPDHDISNLAAHSFASKKETIARADRMYSEASDWLSLPPGERADSRSPDLAVERLPHRFFALKMLLPATGKAAQVTDATATARARASIVVALERQRSTEGSYPATLDQLAPAYLLEIPLDPISGRPFEYKRAKQSGATEGHAPYSLSQQGGAAAPPAPAAGAD